MIKASSSFSALNSSWRYRGPAIFLHWLLALLLTGMVALGWYMMDIESTPGSGWYFDLHKSIGLIVASLVILRLLWRVTHAPQALPSHLPQWQMKFAKLTHWLLYTCMVVMPASGFIGASLSEDGVAFFGLALPRWATANHDLSEQFFGIHSIAAWVLVGLVALHALAGLKHLLVDKDGVFQRMWW
jgi:cytochrome b561